MEITQKDIKGYRDTAALELHDQEWNDKMLEPKMQALYYAIELKKADSYKAIIAKAKLYLIKMMRSNQNITLIDKEIKKGTFRCLQ